MKKTPNNINYSKIAICSGVLLSLIILLSKIDSTTSSPIIDSGVSCSDESMRNYDIYKFSYDQIVAPIFQQSSSFFCRIFGIKKVCFDDPAINSHDIYIEILEKYLILFNRYRTDYFEFLIELDPQMFSNK